MIGVIADDLTGAAELAGVGLRYGLSAEVVSAPETGGDAELVCVDTDSRSCPPEDAGCRAAEAAGKLRASRAEWIYKKVDSVLRGHIVAELEAIMAQFRLNRALLLPANPALGRIIRDGQYFIGGKPIHETDFRFDPEYPRSASSVRMMIGTSGSLPVRVCGLHGPLPSEGIIVGEAQSADDLTHWASRSDAFTLASGASEFFAALLEKTGRNAVSSASGLWPTPKDRRQLFVSGSASEAGHDFLAESRKQGVPVFCLPAESVHETELGLSAKNRLARQVNEALESNPRVVLGIGLPPVRDPRVARRLASHLTQLAEAVLLRAPVGHVYAEGGATAANLIRRLGWTRLRALREIAPGVVTFRIADNPRCVLTLKAGSYAWPKEM